MYWRERVLQNPRGQRWIRESRYRKIWLAVYAAAALVLSRGATLAQSAPSQVRSASGHLADGALWRAQVPDHWNGTLLLFSHGYAPRIVNPRVAPRGTRSWLLAHGYALIASSYSEPGWALAQAVPDQLGALDAFKSHFGKPARTIAWGESMGGLVTVALAERYPGRFAGAAPECGSLAGSIGMMNEALDGAFAFKTLLAPSSRIRLVNTQNDERNAQRVNQVLQTAMRSPKGRARVALASALAQMPFWTQAGTARPQASQPAIQLRQVASAFTTGVFLPRANQEKRAGGNFSWNVGVHYRKQLRMSGEQAWVKQWYNKAGLSLNRDLSKLDAAKRIRADPEAIAYMQKNYVPSGRLSIPVLSMHTIGDGMTVPTQQQSYIDAVRAAGREKYLSVAWVDRAGHCNFTPAERIASLTALISRINTGTWRTSPTTLNALAARTGLGSGHFVPHRSAPFLRPCVQGERCMPRATGKTHRRLVYRRVTRARHIQRVALSNADLNPLP